MDGFTSIAAFVHAAEQHSYVGAARVAGVSPSAIGKAIQRLEGRLGVRLFSRTTRSISLTEEGAIFYERCKRIVDDMADAEATLLRSRERPKGGLRVSVPHIVGHHILMPLLPDFSARFPEIELDINFDDKVADLVTERIDVAVRSGDLADTRLTARVLCEQHFVVCGSPDYFERFGYPSTPDDLARHACIHFKYPSSGRVAPWAFGASYEQQRHLPKGLTINNTDAGMKAALAGMGLAHLPVYVAEPYLESGRLAPVLTEFMVPLGSLSLVWPSSRQLSPKVRAFVDFMVQSLGSRQKAFRPAADLGTRSWNGDRAAHGQKP